MKNILLALMLITSRTAVAQQLVLTGSVTPAKPVELNDTYDGNYWKKNAAFVTPDASGHFRKTFTSTTPKWLWIGDEMHRKWVLLSPDRPLHVTIKNDQLVFSGTGRPENELISSLGLETIQHLPFMKELKENPSCNDAPVDSVIRFKIPQILHDLDSMQQRVHHARLPAALEKIIQTELRYHYANAIIGGLSFWLNRGNNRRDFHLHFIDTVQAHFPVPTQTELEISPAANVYLNHLFMIRLWKAFYVYRDDKDRVHADSVFLKTTGTDYAALKPETPNDNEMLIFHAYMTALLPTYA